jgi:hypothetical protein
MLRPYYLFSLLTRADSAPRVREGYALVTTDVTTGRRFVSR